MSRAYLFENGERADGKLFANQGFEWVAEGISSELDNESMQDMCYQEVGLTRFEAVALRNEIFTGNIRDFPEDEREIFDPQGIRSIATVPINVDGKWWGFIGFDDCVIERVWSAAELDALRTAASLVAAAIVREHAEAVLREHEQKLRAVFDTALDAIFITDDDRRYVDVNPAGCDLIGVSKRDLIGRHLDEFLPPERIEHVQTLWAEYIKGGPVREEWQTMRPDGTVVVSEASARPNFVPGLHIAFMRDITDRKRLESELLSAQKLESLGRLAGGVAHDFNNLLTGITGYASLLLERADDDTELARDLGEIKRAADRAAELTKQLLAFGRRQVLKPRPLDLNTVLADVGGMLQRLLGDHVELELLPAPELGIVRADPGQIEQVIVNLAVNASDAMESGGRLSIATRNADDGSVELVVSDTGIGMDDQTLARIFEPFFTTRDLGVGLGLASVYGIVHQSGGEVTVESTPGTGSVFTVRLPRILEPATEVQAAPEPAALPGLGDDPARRGRGRRSRAHAPSPGAERLHRAAVCQRRAGDRARRERRPEDPPAPHRRRHAGPARLRGRPAGRRHAPRDQDPLHVRLRGGGARRPPRTRHQRADREAVRRRRARPPRPRSARSCVERLSDSR